MKKQLPNANDFNTITTLKDKYCTNWSKLPKQLQDFILSCTNYWMTNTQEILLYNGRQCVASLGTSRYYSDTEINSAGAGSLFQWNLQKGFTVNNM